MGYYECCHEIGILKEDLAVRKDQNILLKQDMRCVHTARHPPLVPATLVLTKQQDKAEASRNMVSVLESVLGITGHS